MTRRIEPKAGEGPSGTIPGRRGFEETAARSRVVFGDRSASAVPHKHLIVEDLVATDPDRKIRIEARKLAQRRGRKDVRFRGEEYVS